MKKQLFPYKLLEKGCIGGEAEKKKIKVVERGEERRRKTKKKIKCLCNIYWLFENSNISY